MKQLNVQDLDQLKIIEFSNQNEAQREIFNYLALSLPRQKLLQKEIWPISALQILQIS